MTNRAVERVKPEEILEILPLAMKGEPFSSHGKPFEIDDVMITPPPLRGEVPPIQIGAVSDPQ
jgi:alkanesulfonate monooxygenase SsuD/methylene tetrahydromethanopterin reductase-like flavin-dependent oxidoreductase (luciferase family)